ncbi:MAG: hypothetical protein ABIG84_00235 [archaeon]
MNNNHHHVHHDIEESELPEARLAVFWIFGAVAIMGGVWITRYVEWVLGTTAASFYGALLVAFLLILFGGLAWIGVAVSVAHHKG